MALRRSLRRQAYTGYFGNGSANSDPKNCGVCGTDCSVPNAETGCLGGTCRVIHCAPGYCDDDGNDENGCETKAKTCHPKAAAAP
jgi:hypothetical protein